MGLIQKLRLSFLVLKMVLFCCDHYTQAFDHFTPLIELKINVDQSEDNQSIVQKDEDLICEFQFAKLTFFYIKCDDPRENSNPRYLQLIKTKESYIFDTTLKINLDLNNQRIYTDQSSNSSSYEQLERVYSTSKAISNDMAINSNLKNRMSIEGVKFEFDPYISFVRAVLQDMETVTHFGELGLFEAQNPSIQSIENLSDQNRLYPANSFYIGQNIMAKVNKEQTYIKLYNMESQFSARLIIKIQSEPLIYDFAPLNDSQVLFVACQRGNYGFKQGKISCNSYKIYNFQHFSQTRVNLEPMSRNQINLPSLICQANYQIQLVQITQNMAIIGVCDYLNFFFIDQNGELHLILQQKVRLESISKDTFQLFQYSESLTTFVWIDPESSFSSAIFVNLIEIYNLKSEMKSFDLQNLKIFVTLRKFVLQMKDEIGLYQKSDNFMQSRLQVVQNESVQNFDEILFIISIPIDAENINLLKLYAMSYCGLESILKNNKCEKVDNLENQEKYIDWVQSYKSGVYVQSICPHTSFFVIETLETLRINHQLKYMIIGCSKWQKSLTQDQQDYLNQISASITDSTEHLQVKHLEQFQCENPKAIKFQFGCLLCKEDTYCIECGPKLLNNVITSVNDSQSLQWGQMIDGECKKCSGNFEIYPETNGFCGCKNGFYKELNELKCEQCPYECLKCDSYEQCTLCKGLDSSSKGFVLKSDIGICQLTECEKGQFFDKIAQSCQLCSDNCQNCDSQELCTECIQLESTDKGFKLNQNTGKCELFKCDKGQFFDKISQSCQFCQDNCQNCTSKEICTECIQLEATNKGFQLNPIEGQCEFLECDKGQFFNKITTTCEKCFNNCKLCNSKISCIECIELESADMGLVLQAGTELCELIKCKKGSFFDIKTQSCQLCSDNCQKCNSRELCTECIELEATDKGFKLNPITGQCDLFKCEKGSFFDKIIKSCQLCTDNCQDCTSTEKCLECQDQYQLIQNGQKCRKCEDKTVLNFKNECVPCRQNCLKCQIVEEKGNQQNKTEQIQCTQCAENNYLGANNRTCECNRGYFADKSREGSCSQCITIESCQESACKNSTFCQEKEEKVIEIVEPDNAPLPNCTVGEYISGKICQKCPDPLCLQCQNQTGLCENCISPFFLIDNECGCLEGNFVDLESRTCKNCPNNCKSCENEYTCSLCESQKFINLNNTSCCDIETHFVDQNGQCTLKNECPLNCQNCTLSNDLCLQCMATFKLSADLKSCTCPQGTVLENHRCEQCPENCFDCLKSSTCNLCQQGYILQANFSDNTDKSCVKESNQKEQANPSQIIYLFSQIPSITIKNFAIFCLWLIGLTIVGSTILFIVLLEKNHHKNRKESEIFEQTSPKSERDHTVENQSYQSEKVRDEKLQNSQKKQSQQTSLITVQEKVGQNIQKEEVGHNSPQSNFSELVRRQNKMHSFLPLQENRIDNEFIAKAIQDLKDYDLEQTKIQEQIEDSRNQQKAENKLLLTQNTTMIPSVAERERVHTNNSAPSSPRNQDITRHILDTRLDAQNQKVQNGPEQSLLQIIYPKDKKQLEKEFLDQIDPQDFIQPTFLASRKQQKLLQQQDCIQGLPKILQESHQKSYEVSDTVQDSSYQNQLGTSFEPMISTSDQKNLMRIQMLTASYNSEGHIEDHSQQESRQQALEVTPEAQNRESKIKKQRRIYAKVGSFASIDCNSPTLFASKGKQQVTSKGKKKSKLKKNNTKSIFET